MSHVLLASSIHLGIELLGGVAFFIVSWLFFEAFLLKRDAFSFERALGFFLLSAWHVIHAVQGEVPTISGVSFWVYLAGLSLVFLSYVLERLPPKPPQVPAIVALPAVGALIHHGVIFPLAFLILATWALFRRYSKDIDRLLKWLAIGFALLSVAEGITLVTRAVLPSAPWMAEHGFRIAGFIAVAIWAWRFLSLRIRDEILIVFVSVALFTALLVTTTFSTFLVRGIERETEGNLLANAKTLVFYLESLKNGALAASQIIAHNEDLASAATARDLAGLGIVSGGVQKDLGVGFLTVSSRSGEVFFKHSFPIVQGENVLAERIGAGALEGRVAVTIAAAPVEGISIRAAAPFLDRGRIAGAVVTGFLLDDAFTRTFKEVSGAETTVFIDGQVVASSLYPRGYSLEGGVPGGGGVRRDKISVGSGAVSGKEVFGAFLPLEGDEGQPVGTLALTVTPADILARAQATNRLTLLIVSIIALVAAFPLYRFTLFLTR